jgi:hypothetical protein
MMGTRGAVGFILDGKPKITYNHFDSYPDRLGREMVAYCRSIKDWNAIEQKVRDLRMVAERMTPKEADVIEARRLGLVDTNVGAQSEADYYCLLRHAQGRLDLVLRAGFMVDNHAFMTDSLFNEFSYIINLDTNEIEFYEGFNTDWNAPGRYASQAKKTVLQPHWAKDKTGKTMRMVVVDYAGVKLVGTAPLSDIPDDWQERFYPESIEQHDREL